MVTRWKAGGFLLFIYRFASNNIQLIKLHVAYLSITINQF